MATYRNAVLIYNPFAGRLRGKRVELVSRVMGVLSAAGHQVSAVPTTGPRTAGRLAGERIEAGADLVLSLGGDGTLNEVLNGMALSQTPLAVLPAGTANVLARELGGGCDPIEVAARIGDWAPLRVSLGLLRAEPGPLSRYFLLMAGVGFDAHIVYRLNLPLKFRFGQIAYWLGAARELGRRLEQVEVRINGQSYSCSFALASRVRNYAGYLRIARRSSLLRDDFEVALFQAGSAGRLYTRYLAPVLTGRTYKMKSVSFLHARQVSFSDPAGGRVYVQVDGEYAGRLPASVEIVPAGLTLLVPPEFMTSG